MAIFEKLTPQFWHYRDVATQPYERMFNYRRMWQLAVFLTALVALLPLLVIASCVPLGQYQMSREMSPFS